MSEQEQAEFNRLDGDFIDLLLTRRSTLARNMTGPGPDKTAIDMILAAGARVPDHGKLAPWRFQVFTGASRAELGDAIADAISREKPDSTGPTLQALRHLPLLAPALIAVTSAPVFGHKIPVWEQELSAGAVCQNMLLAAISMGFAGQWITGQAAYSKGVAEYLGLAESERVAGFVFLGSPSDAPLTERPRPDLTDLVTWQG